MEVPKLVVAQGPMVTDIGYSQAGRIVRDAGCQLRKSCSQPAPKWQISGNRSILPLSVYAALLTSVRSEAMTELLCHAANANNQT